MNSNATHPESQDAKEKKNDSTQIEVFISFDTATGELELDASTKDLHDVLDLLSKATRAVERKMRVDHVTTAIEQKHKRQLNLPPTRGH